ncbi:hypothetical protein C8R47DRAFT_1079005 [Mycena vitilis]|nr:hypothetical protein C8R47DRAFT_1079005 [Mycena vitilis]
MISKRIDEPGRILNKKLNGPIQNRSTRSAARKLSEGGSNILALDCEVNFVHKELPGLREMKMKPRKPKRGERAQQQESSKRGMVGGDRKICAQDGSETRWMFRSQAHVDPASNKVNFLRGH